MGHYAANRDVPIRSSPDPTDTEQLRNEWKREFDDRVQLIRTDFYQTIVTNDAFRLLNRAPGDERTQDDLAPELYEYWRSLHTNDRPVDDPQPDDLRTVEDAARLDQLDAWLDTVFGERLIDPLPAENVRDGEHWTGDYLRRAYVHGDRLAIRDLRRAGFDIEEQDPSDILFDARNKPLLHQEFSETYHDIEYVANDLKRDIHRDIADLLNGDPSRQEFYEAARDQLTGQGANRFGQIVDVRVVETVNKAELVRFDATSGADTLGVEVEETTGNDVGLDANHVHAYNNLADHIRGFLSRDEDEEDHFETPDDDEDAVEDDDAAMRHETAGDENVCAECRSLGGRVVTTRDALQGRVTPIPVHPHCRCRWIFVDNS